MKCYKLISAMGFLTFSCVLIAGQYKDEPVCTGEILRADHSLNGIYGSVTGSWLRPTETDIGMVTDSWQFTNNGATLDEDRPVKTSHEFEGGFTIGYDFNDSANNIEFNYYHLNNDTRTVNTPGNGETLFTSYFFPGATFPPGPDFVSDATLSYKIQQGDIKVGRQYGQCNGAFSIRPSIGIRYAELTHDLTFTAPGFVRSKFKGAGPLFSVDGQYNLAYGFKLVGYVDTAFLVGETDANSNLSFGGSASFRTPEKDRLVTNLNGRIGLAYNHVFANQMHMSLEGGYQASQYFNPFDLLRGNVTFTPALAGVGIADIITTDLGVRGPYIKVGVHA